MANRLRDQRRPRRPQRRPAEQWSVPDGGYDAAVWVFRLDDSTSRACSAIAGAATGPVLVALTQWSGSEDVALDSPDLALPLPQTYAHGVGRPCCYWMSEDPPEGYSYVGLAETPFVDLRVSGALDARWEVFRDAAESQRAWDEWWPRGVPEFAQVARRLSDACTELQNVGLLDSAAVAEKVMWAVYHLAQLKYSEAADHEAMSSLLQTTGRMLVGVHERLDSFWSPIDQMMVGSWWDSDCYLGVCRRCSAIAFLDELYADTALGPYLEQPDEDGYDFQVLRGDAWVEEVPSWIPESHWWWWPERA